MDSENMKDKIFEAFNSAVKKSDNFAQTSRLKIIIRRKKSEIDSIYREIGEKFYKLNKENEPYEKLNKLCEKINKIQEEIDNLYKEIENYK